LLRLDYVHGNSQNPIKDTLYFNTLKVVQNKFSKNERVTEIDFRMATWYNNRANEYKRLEGDDFKWYKKTAVELATAAIAKFPRSYGALECKNLIYTIQAKSYNLIIEEVNEPNKPFRALVTSKNIKKVYYDHC
jgi:hypothetical protein